MILDLCIFWRLPPTCARPSRLLAGLVRFVNAIFLPACVALACLFLRILAPLMGFSLALQVLARATILPFLGPDTHLNPDFNRLPLLLNICPMPSAMADTQPSGAGSCGATACAMLELMALGVFGWTISEIFIPIFMELIRDDPAISYTPTDRS